MKEGFLLNVSSFNGLLWVFLVQKVLLLLVV